MARRFYFVGLREIRRIRNESGEIPYIPPLSERATTLMGGIGEAEHSITYFSSTTSMVL
jgi:hypothetical protein